jgi:hypothetical protein
MKTLILHLGLPKTSSTSIQETFLYNPGPLAAAGFDYVSIKWPDGPRNSNHSFPMIVSFSDGWQRSPEITRRGYSADGLKQHFMQAILRALDTDQNLILSGEDITNIPEEGLRAFSALAADKGFEVRPIMFVRPPLEFVTSMSQTRVRHGEGHHVFKVGLSNKITISLKIWPNLLAIAFKDAIHHPHGPLGRLLDAFQLPSADKFNVITSNESMSEFATRIIGHLNTQIPLFLDGTVNPLRKYLDTEPLAQIKGPKFKLTRAEFLDVRNLIQSENANFERLLGANFCDPHFSFQDAPQAWTTAAIEELSVAMQTLSPTLQNSIRGYFSTSTGLSASEIALASKILA